MQDVEAVFARRLRELREARKLSQARLAEQVGIDATAVTKIERGQRRASLGEAVAFAAALGASVDEMCADSPAASERDLRRELALAEGQLANAEGAMYSANYAYTEARERVEELREQLAAGTADDGEAAAS